MIHSLITASHSLEDGRTPLLLLTALAYLLNYPWTQNNCFVSLFYRPPLKLAQAEESKEDREANQAAEDSPE